MEPPTSADPSRNAILRSLPAEERQRLLEASEVVDMDLRQQVFRPDEPVKHVYFPISAVISLVAHVEGEIAVEVATIGAEGMVGLHVFLGAATSPQEAFCQIAGTAVRLPVPALRAATGDQTGLRDALSRHTQATIALLAQKVACNRAHTAEERAARWLLMTRDRVETDTFPLTQQFLAQMLGVRRPTVSLTARVLQAAGYIRYSRGIITVTDPEGLLEASCDCYMIIRKEFDRLTPA